MEVEDVRQTILDARRRHNDTITKGFSGNEMPYDIEKAHADGEVHKNGKWHWVSSAAGGKGDWRVITAKKQAPDKAPEQKEDSSKQPAVKDDNKLLSGIAGEDLTIDGIDYTILRKPFDKDGNLQGVTRAQEKNSGAKVDLPTSDVLNAIKKKLVPTQKVSKEDKFDASAENFDFLKTLTDKVRNKVVAEAKQAYLNGTSSPTFYIIESLKKNKVKDTTNNPAAKAAAISTANAVNSIAQLESKVPGHLIMKERKEFIDAKLDLEDWEKEKITPQNKSGYDAAQKSLAEAAKKYREALNARLGRKNPVNKVNNADELLKLKGTLADNKTKLAKYQNIRQNSMHPYDPQKKVSDYVQQLKTNINTLNFKIKNLEP